MAPAPSRSPGIRRAADPAPDFSEVDAYTFTCLPGCGFCCTCSPGLLEDEPVRLKADPVAGPFVVMRDSGTMGLALKNGNTACNFLQEDRRCGVYTLRPTVCRTFPFHFHFGERIQVNGNLGCRGLWTEAMTPDADPREAAGPMARVALERILTREQREAFTQAKATYAEFRRRTESIGTYATPEDLREAYAPHLNELTTRRGFENWFALLAMGQVALASIGRDLPAQEPQVGALDLLEEMASESFLLDPRRLPAYVDDALQWTSVKFADGTFTWYHHDKDRKLQAVRSVGFDELEPFNLTPAARAVVREYLETLLNRDHTWGYAAKIVDSMGYEVDVAAAYGRVLADAAGNVLVRAALVARMRDHPQVTEEDAREGVIYYDMGFLNMPTIGAVS